eukprot:TRINITY_DN82734_c0_g1_i1.p1 TRINITY_DN82734_c0_g1~~TRINITY_DN82734_c0_g1_i1.p1  ORF type:complete len:601 (-),score=126.75 TRINITY_DN82734_c0_g1_i1:288-2021(-)
MDNVKDFLEVSLTEVQLPKAVVLKNRRLAFLHRFLQLGALSLVVFTIAYEQIWYENFTPNSGGMTAWNESPDPVAFSNSDVKHCTDLDSFRFEWSSDWIYAPTSCWSLPSDEQFYKDGHHIFYPTYIVEHEVWKGRGLDCAPNAKACGINNGSLEQSTRACSCSFPQDEYFVKNAEEQRLYILHRFRADLEQGITATGSVEMDHHELKFRDGRTEKVEAPMLTKFRKSDGSPCYIGGKDVWSQEDARHGIGGTLTEWIRCAGVDSFDSDPLSVNEIHGLPPHLRIMGFVLDVNVNYVYPYAKGDFNGMLAEVSVSVRTSWNSKKLLQHASVPPSFSSGESQRVKYMYGVSTSFTVSGRYKRFNPYTLINGLVNAFVIMAFPAFVIQFLALNCIGNVSKVYKEALQPAFNIYDSFIGLFAKVMVSASAYRVMNHCIKKEDKAFSEKVSNMKGFRKSDLTDFVRDIFQTHIKNEVLQDHELETLLHFILGSVTGGDKAGINWDRFMEATLSAEAVHASDMVSFIDHDRVRSLGERLLDDASIRDSQVKKMLRASGSNLSDNSVDGQDTILEEIQTPVPL